jgi:hypothetical protein
MAINSKRRTSDACTDEYMNERGATQHRSNLVQDGDLLAGSHSIINRWKKYFSHLLNICSVSDVWQECIHLNQPS